MKVKVMYAPRRQVITPSSPYFSKFILQLDRRTLCLHNLTKYGSFFNHASLPSTALILPSSITTIPYLLRDFKGSSNDWMLAQTRLHNSPLPQIFIRPFDNPFVLLSDYREAQDILMRRKEWDRNDWSIALLSGNAPQHHISMKTGQTWKAHRSLLQDLVTPKFLEMVETVNI
jgi:hypothetical protein